MTDTPTQNNYRHLFGGIIVVFAAFAVQIIAMGAYIFLALELQNDIIRFGLDNVPADRLGGYIWLSQYIWPILFIASVVAFIAAMLLFYQAGKTLVFLGVKQYFGPTLTAWGLLIPFYCVYRPWAGLGEVRNTLSDARRERRIPPSGVRGANGETIFYAISFYAYMLTDRFIDRYADRLLASDPVNSSATANLYLDKMSELLFIATLITVIFLGISVWYWMGVIRLFKHVLSLRLNSADRN
jgi:hypothetical protein